MLVYFIHFNF